MANLPYYFNGNTVTPAGTDIDTPLVTNVDLPTIWLTSIRVRMPPGPLGNLGFAFYNANSQIIPYSGTPSYVTGDNEIWNFDYGQEVGIQLALWTYNTGSDDHELLYIVNYTPISAANLASSSTIELTDVPPLDVPGPENNVFQDFGTATESASPIAGGTLATAP